MPRLSTLSASRTGTWRIIYGSKTSRGPILSSARGFHPRLIFHFLTLIALCLDQAVPLHFLCSALNLPWQSAISTPSSPHISHVTLRLRCDKRQKCNIQTLSFFLLILSPPADHPELSPALPNCTVHLNLVSELKAWGAAVLTAMQLLLASFFSKYLSAWISPDIRLTLFIGFDCCGLNAEDQLLLFCNINNSLLCNIEPVELLIYPTISRIHLKKKRKIIQIKIASWTKKGIENISTMS